MRPSWTTTIARMPGPWRIGSFSAANLGFTGFPTEADLSPVQAYGAGLPGVFIQGLGSPSDKFNNIPMGFFWQDSWRVNPNVTLNYGLRYDNSEPNAEKLNRSKAA